MTIRLEEVDESNWRDICELKVFDHQTQFVADPAYYLCLCANDKLWHPLAITGDGAVIGFMMWAVDDEDGSCWLGGILIDKEHQSKGYGKIAITAAIHELSARLDTLDFALSYSPDNPKKRLYESLGFLETGEMEDDECVARLKLA